MELSIGQQKSIITMVQAGATNGQVSLKFPGVTRKQIEGVRGYVNGATKETKRKLKPDPLQYLYRQKRIDSSDLISAERIRNAHRIITGEVASKISAYGEDFGRSSATGSLDESEYSINLQEQYQDWAIVCRARKVRIDPIIHVLTEPVSLHDTDRRYRQANGTAGKQICAGLKAYSNM